MIVAERGRDALFFSGLMWPLIAIELSSAFPYHEIYPSTRIGPVGLEYVESDCDSALILQGSDEVRTKIVREVLADSSIVGVGDVVREAVSRDAIRLPVIVHAERMADEFGLIGADRATARLVAGQEQDLRRRLLVFLAGMIGQDVADRVRSVLGGHRVTADDLPRPFVYRLHRYVRTPDQVLRMLWVAADMMPALENTAFHLGIR